MSQESPFYTLGATLGGLFDDDYAERQKRIAAEQAERERQGHAASNAAIASAWDEFLAGGAGGTPPIAKTPVTPDDFAFESRAKAGTLTPPPSAPGVLPGSWTHRSTFDELLKESAPKAAPVEAQAELPPGPSLEYTWGKSVPLGPGGRPVTDSTLFEPVTQASIQGRESIGGGGYSGPAVGAGASIEDWQKNVANPMAFSAFREIPEIAKMEAERKMAETLTEDPFARERMQGEMEAQRVALPALVRGKIDRASEQERRTMYLSERKKIDDRYMEEAIKARSAKDENAEYRAAEAHQAAIDALNAAFGLGARMSSNALYQQSGG